MAIWIRGPENGRWHAGEVPQPDSLPTHCGLTLGSDAMTWPPGDLPPHWERCLECDAQVVMQRRRRRLAEIFHASQLEAAIRRYRDG